MSLVLARQDDPTYDSRVAFCQLILGIPSASVDGKFGVGTESKVKNFQSANGITPDGRVDEQTGRAMGLTLWDAQLIRTLDVPFRDPEKFPPTHAFIFGTFAGGGYFAHKPDLFISSDPRTKRSIRTNNAGALNFGNWQVAMPGYVGRTQADNSPQANKTTIYQTPEEGIVAWYVLIAHRYETAYHLISGGTGSTINIKRLAKTYGLGKPDKPDSSLSQSEREVVHYYLAGWQKWSQRLSQPIALEADTEIIPGNSRHMTSLANAMFSHECSFATPLMDMQIKGGLEMAQLWVRTGSTQAPLGEAEAVLPLDFNTEREMFSARASIEPNEVRAEEEANSSTRYQGALRALQGQDAE